MMGQNNPENITMTRKNMFLDTKCAMIVLKAIVFLVKQLVFLRKNQLLLWFSMVDESKKSRMISGYFITENPVIQ